MAAGTERTTGKIIEVLGSSFRVSCNGDVIESFHRGKFRISEDAETFPVVGDNVELINTPNGYLIDKIAPRTSKISRQEVGSRGRREQVLIANLEKCVIVSSVDEPPFKPRLVDRMIVSALKGGLKPIIVLNKVDLMRNFNLDFWRDLYEGIGYPFIPTCALTGEGVSRLKKHLENSISVFTGHSGVGKSSLLNIIQPGLGLATEKVSRATSKGRHTTARTTMHPVDKDSYVVDTPGLKELGLWEVQRKELAWYFEEFRPFISECKFRNCLHLKEPACAVRKAVSDGKISEVRYESYIRILESI
jgi:ribosome biogenesis GTPase